jgi:DNA primase
MRYSKDQILLNIKISDIAEPMGVSLSPVNSGNFTHKSKCPGEDHKSGLEKTGSLYIDDVNNNFYCFGCGASNNAIDFYILCTGKTFSDSITDLSKMIDPSNVKKTLSAEKQSIFPIMLEISNLFRQTQIANPKDLVWISKLMKRTDSYILKLDRYDIVASRKLLRLIDRAILRRYATR